VENKRSVNFHDARDKIDSRDSDLCNHVGFTDVAAPRGCWRLFEQKKSLASQLREGAEASKIIFIQKMAQNVNIL
jgi:hypothetical protein